MSPITKTKTQSAGDVGRVFDLLRLSTDQDREKFRALARVDGGRDPKLVYVTRLSNGSDPISSES